MTAAYIGAMRRRQGCSECYSVIAAIKRGDVMIKIAILSPYDLFESYEKPLCAAFQSENALIKVLTPSKSVYGEKELALFAEKEGFDAIIARGTTFGAAKKYASIPVVNANESLHDLLTALYKQRNTHRRILVALQKSSILFIREEFRKILDEVFGIRMTLMRYNDMAEVSQLFYREKDAFDVFIGGAFVMKLCEENGKTGVWWETGYDTFHMKVRECISIIKAKEQEELQKNQIEIILNKVNEGIIFVDDNLIVRMLNPKAKQILQIPEKEKVLGLPLQQIACGEGIAYATDSCRRTASFKRSSSSADLTETI
jgi:PAS domain-containing protein